MAAAPRICSWQRHLMEAAEAAGHRVEARRARTGSTVWRINAGRWTPTGPASRKLEIIVYGKVNP